MINEISLSYDDTIKYIRENVEIDDLLEISYNRIFAPGNVTAFHDEDEETGEGFRVSLHLNGEIINQVVTLDFKEIKDDLLEIHHYKDDIETVIEID